MTIVILVLCAIISGIPTPGTNTAYFKTMLEASASLHFVNALTGGGLSRLSLTLLGITPYITASIIMQLLAVIWPKIKDMQKEKTGKTKIDRLTFLLGVVLALIQAVTMSISYGRQGLLINYTWYWVLLVAMIWTAGATLLAFAGKLIEKRYFGNGISLILLLGILSSYPSDMMTLYQVFLSGRKLAVAITATVIIALIIFAVFAFTTLIQLCEKRIHVNYAGKLIPGTKQLNIIPIKLCPGGVVPIIFASSLLSFPFMLGQAFTDSFDGIWGFLNSGQWFNPAKPYYTAGALLYVIMIFGFSYFYADITFSPYEIADNLRKNGGMIDGIRPGQPTGLYLQKQLKYMIAIGAAALTVIAFIPLILSNTAGISRLAFLGTSIIITVGVILDTKKKYIADSSATKYIAKIKKGGIFHD